MKNNLINIDTIKKGDTTMYNQKVNNDETLKRVQGDGRPAWQTKSALTQGETAKEVQNLSVIPQRFRGVLPESLPCGISKKAVRKKNKK